MMRTVWQSLLGVVGKLLTHLCHLNVRKDNDKVVEDSGEAEDSTGKDAEVPIKVIPMPKPPPLSSEIIQKDRGW